MNPSMVQQPEPTRAMRIEKLGMATTISPDTSTSTERSTHYISRERGGETDYESCYFRSHSKEVVGISSSLREEHSFQYSGHREHHDWWEKG